MANDLDIPFDPDIKVSLDGFASMLGIALNELLGCNLTWTFDFEGDLPKGIHDEMSIVFRCRELNGQGGVQGVADCDYLIDNEWRNVSCMFTSYAYHRGDSGIGFVLSSAVALALSRLALNLIGDDGSVWISRDIIDSKTDLTDSVRFLNWLKLDESEEENPDPFELCKQFYLRLNMHAL